MYLLATLDIIVIIGSIIGYRIFDLPFKLAVLWCLSGLTGLYFCHQTIILMSFNKF